MQISFNSFYAEWRVRSGAVPLLRDDRDSPPENLLQAIWQHQRLLRDRLTTLDGRKLQVLHPGFRSLEGGPDFRQAVIEFGEDVPLVTDVEVDLRPSGWRAHGHHTNPAFKSVGLHVVWEAEQPAPGAPPTLRLNNVLDAPLGHLGLWLGGEAGLDLPDEFRGKCCAPLRDLPLEEVRKLLLQAAQVRLQSKASQLEARARNAGWEQSLWEGLFRALGYKHNVWPMQRIGELRSRWSSGVTSPLHLQARLLGIAGLLPPDLPGKNSRASAHVRQLWDLWWRDQDTFADCVLPRSLWRLHGLRPANSPARRLALAGSWSCSLNLDARIREWSKTLSHATEGKRSNPAAALLKMLMPGPDEFWSRHLSFNSAICAKPQPLIGETRLTDIAINVILPWLWIRAGEGKGRELQQTVENCYLQWPPAEDNAVLKLARQRLLGGAHRGVLNSAAAQQGLIQITRDFCDHSNAICHQCRLPEMVKEMRQSFRGPRSGTADLQNTLAS